MNEHYPVTRTGYRRRLIVRAVEDTVIALVLLVYMALGGLS